MRLEYIDDYIFLVVKKFHFISKKFHFKFLKMDFLQKKNPYTFQKKPPKVNLVKNKNSQKPTLSNI